MARTPLHAVQTQRETTRDDERVKLGKLLAEQTELQSQITKMSDDKAEQLAEVADIAAVGRVDVRAAAMRRYYSSYIDRELIMLSAALQELNREIDQQRHALATADAAVKAVSNLIEKREDEARVAAMRRDQLRVEDEWAAGQASR